MQRSDSEKHFADQNIFTNILPVEAPSRKPKLVHLLEANNKQINGMQLNVADGFSLTDKRNNESQNPHNFGCTSATPGETHHHTSLLEDIKENSLLGTKNESVNDETEALFSEKPKLIHQIEVVYSDMVLCSSSLGVDLSYAEGAGNKTVTVVRDQVEGDEVLDGDLHRCFCIYKNESTGERKI